MIKSQSSAKDNILGAIRNSMGNEPITSEKSKELKAKLTSPKKGIIPARSKVKGQDLTDLFIKMAKSVSATVVELSSLDEVPQAVMQYLADYNLPSKLKMADHKLLNDIDWQKHKTLNISKGASAGDDLVSLSVAYAAIGETGSLMMLSGKDAPTTLNFLPESHLVILQKSDLVGSYEETWDMLRRRQKPVGGDLPRNINIITGPSRTGDIEQVILLGAHGPHRLHIILIDQ